MRIRGSNPALPLLAIALALAPMLPDRAEAQEGAEPAADPVAGKAVPSPVLQPGDVVLLRIWREPDLSGEFPIAADGVVVLPKIGPLRATDGSPEALEAEIVEQYRRYLRNPSIEVVFLRRVNVQGAVGRPGLYPVDPTLTVADALALAGGVLPNGRPDRIELRRDGERLVVNIDENTRLDELPIRSGDQLYVPERSWIVRNQGLVGAILSATTSILLTVLTLYAN